MNKIVLNPLSLMLFALTVIGGLLGLSWDVSAGGPKEVVLIECTGGQPFGTGPFQVSQRSTNSAGAPPVAVGSNCAQALADYRTAGFKTTSAQIVSSGSPLYTLESGADDDD